MNPHESEWDAIVVGGGPAGAVAALVMARAGVRVLLVDAPPLPTAAECHPPQCDTPSCHPPRKIGETLPGAATPLLRDLGLLPLLHQGGHLPCHGTLSAWGSETLTAVDFLRDPHGHGWRLNRRAFDTDLRATALTAGTHAFPGRVCGVERVSDHWRLCFRDGSRLRSHWLVDATGRGAALARQLGAERQRDTGLVAVHGWFRRVPHPDRDGDTDRPPDADTRTLVEAEPDGWWYMALLPDGSRAVACHVESKAAAALLHTPGAFEERLFHHTASVRAALAGTRRVEPLRAVDAGGARLRPFGGDGWLAVGDAALSFDPLSSQGIFTALYTGMKAGQAIVHALSSDRCTAPDDYLDRLESIRAAYLRHWTEAYRSERRWKEHPFWRSRHQDLPA